MYLRYRRPNRSWRMQCTARADAVYCKGGCSALQGRMQCTASEMGNTGTEIVSPILDKRKGRRDTPHMGHSSPLIYLLSRENPCGWSSGLHPESAISVMKEPMDMVQSVHTALWKRLSVRTTRWSPTKTSISSIGYHKKAIQLQKQF